MHLPMSTRSIEIVEGIHVRREERVDEFYIYELRGADMFE